MIYTTTYNDISPEKKGGGLSERAFDAWKQIYHGS